MMKTISTFLRASGLVALGLIFLAALSASFLYPAGPLVQVATPYTPVGTSMEHILGTDRLGRDVLAVLLYGARTSLTVGVVAAATAVFVGIVVGMIAGYARGFVDDALMRFTEIFQTIPAFLLAIVLVVIMGSTATTIVIAIAIVSWPPVARLVRGEFLSLTQREFVQSCQLLGMRSSQIVVREILPNAISPIVVIASVMIANAILMEAALSFLGLGDPNVASWGLMIAEARPAIRTATYLSVIPGIAIIITILSVNSVADQVTKAMNPKTRVTR